MTEFIKLKTEYLQFGSVESHIMKHVRKHEKVPIETDINFPQYKQTTKYNKGLRRDISRNIIKRRDWPNHFKIKEHLGKAPRCRKAMAEFVLPASTVKELVVKVGSRQTAFEKVIELAHVFSFQFISIYQEPAISF